MGQYRALSMLSNLKQGPEFQFLLSWALFKLFISLYWEINENIGVFTWHCIKSIKEYMVIKSKCLPYTLHGYSYEAVIHTVADTQ